jgi:hypothetical protein
MGEYVTAGWHLTPVTIVEPSGWRLEAGEKVHQFETGTQYFGSPWLAFEIQEALVSIGFIDRSSEPAYTYVIGHEDDRFPDGVVSHHDFIIAVTQDWGFETDGEPQRETVQIALYFSFEDSNDMTQRAVSRLYERLHATVPLEEQFRSDWD